MTIKPSDFSEDAPSIPTPRATGAQDNKFDGLGNPDVGEKASIDFGPTKNEFPHEGGSVSLSDEEVVLS